MNIFPMISRTWTKSILRSRWQKLKFGKSDSPVIDRASFLYKFPTLETIDIQIPGNFFGFRFALRGHLRDVLGSQIIKKIYSEVVMLSMCYINKFYVAILLFMFGSQLWAYNDWYHVRLTSQESIGINIDFQYVGENNEAVNNIWLNINGSSAGLKSTDRVDAHFYNFRRSRDSRESSDWSLDSSVYLRLHWNGSNFTGQWVGVDVLGNTVSSMPISSNEVSGNYEFRQEIIVTVYRGNSRYILIDPVSNSRYFKFSFEQLIDR